MKGPLPLTRAILLTIAACMLLSGPASAKADSRVERKFRGKVVILKKRPPMSFKSQGAWVGFLNRNKTVMIWPDKKVEGEKQWKFEFMAFFNRKLNDVEVNVKFYDITDAKKFIAADSYYLDRGQTIFASSMVLEKPRFAPNRRYVMFIVGAKNNKTLASAKFWLRGKGEVYSGKVEFSDEDAKLKR